MVMNDRFDLISQPLRAASFPSRGSLSSEVRTRFLREWLPCVGGAFFASLGASKPLSGGILLLLRTLRQIDLENGRKVCYNLG